MAKARLKCFHPGMANTLAELKQAAIVNTLRGCQLFAGLGAEDLNAIAAITAVKPLDKGDYLFHEGTPAQGFYITQKGAINVHRVNAAGKEQVIHVFRAGESFAEVALATASGYPADARARSHTGMRRSDTGAGSRPFK